MGVVPAKLEERGAVSDLLDVTFRAVNLSDRKDIMLQEADVAVALPGGVGTLDEIFHVMKASMTHRVMATRIGRISLLAPPRDCTR